MDQETMMREEQKHEERIVQEVMSQKNDKFLSISILVAGMLIAGSVIYAVGMKSTNPAPTPQPTPAAPQVPAIRPSDAVLGDAKAPVTIFEFADYQCPFCIRYEEQSGKQIRDQYVKTGKVNIVFRDFPFLGPESLAAAEAVHCAQDQGKFWEMHDAMMGAEAKDGKEQNGNLDRALFMQLATTLKLNTKDFGTCIDSKKYEAQVLQFRDEATGYGVDSTPTIFVGATKILGAQPITVFTAAINQALAAKK